MQIPEAFDAIAKLTKDQVKKLKQVFGPAWEALIREVAEASDAAEKAFDFKGRRTEDDAVKWLRQAIKRVKEKEPAVARLLEKALDDLEGSEEKAEADDAARLLRQAIELLEDDEPDAARLLDQIADALEAGEYEYPRPRKRRSGDRRPGAVAAAEGQKAAAGDPIAEWAGGTPLGRTTADVLAAARSQYEPLDPDTPLGSWAGGTPLGMTRREPEARGEKSIMGEILGLSNSSKQHRNRITPVERWLYGDDGEADKPFHQRRPARSPDVELREVRDAQKVVDSQEMPLRGWCTLCGRSWPVDGPGRCVCGGPVHPARSADEARRGAAPY